MTLPPRLREVLQLLPEATSVADIGSGHGRLALAAAALGARVVATELTEASFARLRADLAGGDDRVEARRGDGLAALAPGEVEVAVIAGLGGRGILRILDRAPWLPHWLVLQPMQDPQLVAGWLSARGWPCTETRIAQRGRWYLGWRVEVPPGLGAAA